MLLLDALPAAGVGASIAGTVAFGYKAIFIDRRMQRIQEASGVTERLAAEVAARQVQLAETEYWRAQVPVLRDELKVQETRLQLEIAHWKDLLANEQAQNLATRRDMQAVIDDLRNRITLLEARVVKP